MTLPSAELNPEPRPADPTPTSTAPLPVRARLIVAGIGLGTYLVAGLLTRFPMVIERLYGGAVGPAIARLLSRLTGWVPFSLAELLYVAYSVWLAGVGIRALHAIRRGDRSPRHALVGGALRLARDAGVAVTLFYLLWGFNYLRPPLEQRLGWNEWTAGDVDELVAHAREAIAAGNAAYRQLHGVDDAGEPTMLPDDHDVLRAGLDEGWRRAVATLDLPRAMSLPHGPPKTLLSSPIFARLGITGFYFPFTGEANVRAGLPALSLPHTMAHEQAHQRGINPESEASFVAFVVGALAPDPYARYAAVNYATRRLLNALYDASREDWRALWDEVSPGVRRDVEHLAAYFRQFEGVGTTVGRTVNDRFLRANRVQGGVLNYGESLRLLLSLARETGHLVPDR